MKEISKKYLIFIDFRAIVTYGSIKVEQRVDESPLFLVGFQQERVCFAWMRSSRNGSLSYGHRSRARVLHAELDSMVSNKKEYAKGDFMAKRDDYEQKTEALLAPIMERTGFELVDVEYVKEGSNYYLRAYIDKEGGITIDDCEAVSRELSDLLDVEDFIPEAYFLEISSPGLGRQLKKEKDFARSIGEDVEVKLYKPLNKQKEFEGELISYDEENIVLGISEDETLTIPRESIAMIKLAIHF